MHSGDACEAPPNLVGDKFSYPDGAKAKKCGGLNIFDDVGQLGQRRSVVIGAGED
jgi:hypothetical protein